MALFVDGNIIALCNQKLINVNTHVKRGDEILFFVSPEPHYEAQLWEWLSPTANPNLAERTINGKEDAEKNICTIAQIPPGRLAVTSTKLKTVSFSYHKGTVWEKYKGEKIPLWGKIPATGNAHYLARGDSATNNKGLPIKYEYFTLDTELIQYRCKLSGHQYYPDKGPLTKTFYQTISKAP